ncbi:[acyl-carrier-protein] S-malonyltransferase [Kyrpidia spormannii]|uniref:Malonyl CoA-acyl carrier protein transacylase n=2 Tax=Kyrpidia spormannii TaxID=2055160 RepID=A0A2K8N6W7_9BACL|nr:ACP S-malonyltransferase [Kyrpidia spormannii]ATY85078.1 [acyl-carrier-protein] S-malonyltransferase [Kyrpidia spormannii]
MRMWAWVFPGQGAQKVGMGKAVYDTYEEAKKTFQEADAVLGFSLSDLCFYGPEEKLRQTAYTQPAILTASVAMWRVLEARGVRPDVAAGHSLGEYSALVAAGALDFADAVRVVHRRGQYMQEAVPAGGGTMAAVLQADRETVNQVCAEVSREVGPVELANVNCPGQLVISGRTEAVQEAGKRLLERGAKRVLPLEVSGPFHSSLMKPAAQRLAGDLARVPLRDAICPVVSNVDAKPRRKADEIREALVRQVAGPVLWEDGVRAMIAMGVTQVAEVGPGRVVSGLVRKVDRKVEILAAEDPDSLEALWNRWEAVKES